MRVDVHTHIIPKQWDNLELKYGYKGWIDLKECNNNEALLVKEGKNFRQIKCNCWDPNIRKKEMKETKVDLQVLSAVPGVGFNYWAPATDALEVAVFLNDHIAEVCKNDSCFVGLGTVPLQNTEFAIKELRRCIKIGLKGVQIGSHVNNVSLDHPAFYDFWAVVEELDACIFIHPWDMYMSGRMEKYWFPWLIGMPCETTVALCSVIFGGILEKYPKLRICFAHGGGSFPGTIGRIEHGFFARPDLCQIEIKKSPRYYASKIYVDSLVHDSDALNTLIKIFGKDKVMLGSDYPFPLGEQSPGALIDASITDMELRSKIFGLNALEWLGINK